MANKIKVTIDNITIEVNSNSTILEAARLIGGEIVPPTMCYYSKLKGTGGKCRTCLVEVSQGSTKDPHPMPKLQPSCCTSVMDGMVVKNRTSEKVFEARKGIVELLLINHPLDCPVCDQAGECSLQDLSFKYGCETSRYDFHKRTFSNKDLGEYIELNNNRCILCYRCVYAVEELTDGRVHGVLYRGDHAEIATYIEQVVDNDFSGNVIDVCPVGALTDKTFRFKNRVWFLSPLYAHRDCPKCSGKVVLWNRGNQVFRVTARKDEWQEIQDFICNECRFQKKKTSDWIIEGPALIDKKSVISVNHYVGIEKPTEALPQVIDKEPEITFNIKDTTQVNQLNLSKLKKAPTSDNYPQKRTLS
ncbi:MAG: 2Fe-2S iron-sulfur cluster-binding protein [Chitinophagaceae bacterium]